MPRRQRLLNLLAVEGVTVAIALVGLIVFFSVSSEYFLTTGNIQNLLVQSVFVLLVAVGMTFVLIAGGIDLSVGSVLGFSAGTTLLVMQEGGTFLGGVLAGLATGAVVGFVNGAIIAKLRINDFIVTLATLGIVSGFLQVLTSHTQLDGVSSGTFAYLANGLPGGVPFPVIVAAVVVVIFELVLRRTSFGRSVFAIGINHRAAHLSGIGVTRVRLRVYILSGILASAGGIVLASRLNSVQPGLGGGYELQAIAAVVLGGTSIAGGRGSVWRSVVGALVLGVLNNGLQLMGVDPVWYTIITGSSIAVAVASDQVVQKLATARLRGGTSSGAGPAWTQSLVAEKEPVA